MGVETPLCIPLSSLPILLTKLYVQRRNLFGTQLLKRTFMADTIASRGDAGLDDLSPLLSLLGVSGAAFPLSPSSLSHAG